MTVVAFSLLPSPVSAPAPRSAPTSTATPQPPKCECRPPVPTPDAVDLRPGDTVRSLRYADWLVIHAAMPEREGVMARIAFCESRLVPTAIGEDKYLGWYQEDPAHLTEPDVIAAVGIRGPTDLFDTTANAAVASVLARRRPDLGDWPLTRYGCREWNR